MCQNNAKAQTRLASSESAYESRVSKRVTLSEMVEYGIQNHDEYLLTGVKIYLSRQQDLDDEDQRLLDRLKSNLHEWNRPRTQTAKVTTAIFRNALLTLVEEKDEAGKARFRKKVHWIAVFRVAIDKGLIISGDYTDFEYFVKGLNLSGLSVPLSISSLTKAFDGIYTKPYSEWSLEGFLRKKHAEKPSLTKPYYDMVWLVERFLKLLEQGA